MSLRVYPERLSIVAEGQVLCEHVRRIDRSHHLPPRTIYDWRHYLTVIQRKLRALRNGAPFLLLSCRQPSGQLQEQILRAGGETGRWSITLRSSCIMTSRWC